MELFKAPLIIVGKQNYTDFMICANLHSKYLLSSNKIKPMHCFCIGFLYLCSRLIQKVMAKNLLNKYVWLVETINKAKKITFEEINEKWLDIIFPLRVVNADAKILIF